MSSIVVLGAVSGADVRGAFVIHLSRLHCRMHSERPTFPTGREPRGSCLRGGLVNFLDDDNGSGLMVSVFSDFHVWNILNPTVKELGTNVRLSFRM